MKVSACTDRISLGFFGFSVRFQHIVVVVVFIVVVVVVVIVVGALRAPFFFCINAF